MRSKKIEPDFEVGEDVSEEVKLIDLGRRSIQYLRQSLVAKIFEHDSTNIFKQFKDREGDLFTAEVHHIRNREIILLDDDGNEIILPKDRQIPSDFFRKGDNVRGIIESVELRGNKPKCIQNSLVFWKSYLNKKYLKFLMDLYNKKSSKIQVEGKNLWILMLVN